LADVSFVFHKCTEGDNYIDPTYTSRRDAVKQAGKVWGAYHFFRMNASASVQVQWFINHANIAPGDIVALDFETVSYDSWTAYTPKQVADRATDVMNLLRGAFPSNRVILYCNESTLNTYVDRYAIPFYDGLWIADYGSKPAHAHVFWQYGDSPVDKDLSDTFPDAGALFAWANAAVQAYIPPTSTKDDDIMLVPAGTDDHFTIPVAGHSRLVLGCAFNDDVSIISIDYWGSNESGWNSQPVGVGGHVGQFHLNPNMPFFVPIPAGAVIAVVRYTANHSFGAGVS